MTPEEIEALLGAYALDAVDDDERREIEEYLAQNPRARSEVDTHREVATLLAFSGAPAPEGLWDRIAGALEERAPEPGPELAKVLPARAAALAHGGRRRRGASRRLRRLWSSPWSPCASRRRRAPSSTAWPRSSTAPWPIRTPPGWC